MIKPANDDIKSLGKTAEQSRKPYEEPRIIILEMSEIQSGDQHLQEVDAGGWVS